MVGEIKRNCRSPGRASNGGQTVATNATHITIDDNDMDAEILAWFTRQGGTYDAERFGLSQFPGQGRGAIALTDIPVCSPMFLDERCGSLSFP